MNDENETNESIDNEPNEPIGNEKKATEAESTANDSEMNVSEESDVNDVSAEMLGVQLEEARKEAKDNWEKLARVQAEMENLRRRTQKELQDAHKFALEKFTKELLPVFDSFELGIQAASADNGDIVKLREGNELILQQFKSVFEKFNIEIVDPVGEMFNPERHQAMAMEPTEDVDPNTVIKVFQKGYLLNERLIRPAMVVVAQAANPVKIDEQA